MKANKMIYCKEKTKVGTEYRYQQKAVDIYAIKDENGVSLGKHIESMQREIETLKCMYENSKKITNKFDTFIKTIANKMGVDYDEKA